jgi:hypothetical protein
MSIEAKYQQEIRQAVAANDGNKLDLALRAQYHYANRGRIVSTVHMDFDHEKTAARRQYG